LTGCKTGVDAWKPLPLATA